MQRLRKKVSAVKRPPQIRHLGVLAEQILHYKGFDQARFAPGVPHLTNLPFASLQRAVGFLGHFTNFPFASRHGVATAEAEPNTRLTADSARMSLRISPLPIWPGHSCGSKPTTAQTLHYKHAILLKKCGRPPSAGTSAA
jgi:hypothetical protein